MVLKKYCSRFTTPRVKISNETFKSSGIEIFSSEKVPFANRTSPIFAKNVVKLLISRIKRLQKDGRSFPSGIHIYELGAGIGILAKRILDLLKSDYSDIYKKVVLHVSDSSRPMMTQLKTLPDFKKHKGHVYFEIIDALKPRFAHKPLLVYFTNLIDSLPHQRQIVVRDKQIFEFQVQTTLRKDAQIVDATSYPPKILTGKKIATLLASSDIKKRLILAPQILQTLEERARFVPLNEIANLSKEEREDLEKLKNFQDNNQAFAFNYSLIAKSAIRQIIDSLAEGGFIFFSDFGNPDKRDDHASHIEYGLLIFFAVDFLSIIDVAQTCGKSYYITSNTPGHPQEMLIDTVNHDKEMERLFQKKSLGNIQEEVGNFFKKSQEAGEIALLYNSLSPEAQGDYLLLTNLSYLMLQTGHYQEGEHYADILAKKHTHSLGVYYYIVKGKTQQEKGYPKTAEAFFKKAIKNKLGFLAHAYLTEFYWQQKRYPEYIKTLKEYLKYTRKKDHLKSLHSIAAAEKLFDHQAAQKTLKIITDFEKQSLEQGTKLL